MTVVTLFTADCATAHCCALLTGGEGSLTQWVHCEFVVSFEAICPVITQQVLVSSFKKYPPKYPLGTF